MNRTERDARLLCRAEHGELPDVLRDEPVWMDFVQQAKDINAAGLTIMPVEPDDATVEAMARALDPVAFEEWEIDPDVIGAGKLCRERDVRRADARDKARAAYRAAIDGGE